MKEMLTLRVNGKEHPLEVKTHHTLLQVLRDQLKLFGAREGCGVGMCGSCTVLVDGQPVSSCLMFVGQAANKEIVTIEGISENGQLHPVQEAYVECTGYQCSFCTPGFILTTLALLTENPDATEDEIREYLSGNLCRCGSYIKIMDSVRLVQERWARGEPT